MRRFQLTRGMVIAFALIILAITIVSLATAPIPDFGESGREFHPTLEQAFGRREGLGEVIFIDEHEDSVTVFHRIPNWLGQYISHTSHYIRIVQEGEKLYSRTSVATGGFILSNDQESIETHKRLINNSLARDVLYQRIGRRPLYGASRDPEIRNLVINGQHVDYVVEYVVSIPRYGETVFYFWYFSDFHFTAGDEIVISFG